jgi:hypothetical protein
LLLYSSHLPLGVSNGLAIKQQSRVGPRHVGLVERDRVGQDETVFGHTGGAGAVACGAVWVWDVGTSGFCLFRPD